MNIRNGMTVHKIGEHEGQACILLSKTFDSINQAKKANGRNAKTLKRGDKLPRTKADIEAEIQAKKEAEAQQAEAVA